MDKKKSQTKRKARKGKNVRSLTKRFRHRGGVSSKTMSVTEVKEHKKNNYRSFSLARKTKRIAAIKRKFAKEKASRIARSAAARSQMLNAFRDRIRMGMVRVD